MLVFQGSKTNKTYDAFTPRTPQLLLPWRFSSCSVRKKWIASCHLGVSCPTIWGNLASWPITKIYPKPTKSTSKSSTHLEFVANVLPRVILIYPDFGAIYIKQIVFTFGHVLGQYVQYVLYTITIYVPKRNLQLTSNILCCCQGAFAPSDMLIKQNCRPPRWLEAACLATPSIADMPTPTSVVENQQVKINGCNVNLMGCTLITKGKHHKNHDIMIHHLGNLSIAPSTQDLTSFSNRLWSNESLRSRQWTVSIRLALCSHFSLWPMDCLCIYFPKTNWIQNKHTGRLLLKTSKFSRNMTNPFTSQLKYHETVFVDSINR